jgi:SulP family sulfate permease
MSRQHLFSLRIAHALRECFQEGYTREHLIKDILAGLTVGIIAIPLAMALSIAVGLPPQYGLYTAAIAGFLIPLTGGSRYSVSGPTAAFIVILVPVVGEYGFSGLLIATFLSGIMLILMGWARLGRYIEYIPEPVTLGFTGGIAIVIALLQLEDFFGLTIDQTGHGILHLLPALGSQLDQLKLPEMLVGLLTLSVMLLWPKFNRSIPAHLPAVVLGSLCAVLLSRNGIEVATIGNSFSYLTANGDTAWGIPDSLPKIDWPWAQQLANTSGTESALSLNWQTARELLSAAFAIAMLGAIESLLCAVVLDSMSGRRHSANSELVGQGIGNVVTPFFGGITATAALARSAANYRAGAQSPVAAMTHAVVIILAILFFAPILAYLPMSSMAALLLVVAWNMSEAPKSLHLLKSAQAPEIIVFITCLSLTVFMDMVIAIGVGIVMASLLFMKQMAEMTRVSDISTSSKLLPNSLPEGWAVFKINGPLFFAAADNAFGQLRALSQHKQGVILYLDGVSLLDSGGVAALYKYLDFCKQHQTRIYLCDFQFQPLKVLAKSGFKPDGEWVQTFSTLSDALDTLNPTTPKGQSQT